MLKGVISKTTILIMPDAFLKLMVFGKSAKTFEMILVRVTGLSRSSGGPGHCATVGGAMVPIGRGIWADTSGEFPKRSRGGFRTLLYEDLKKLNLLHVVPHGAAEGLSFCYHTCVSCPKRVWNTQLYKQFLKHLK